MGSRVKRILIGLTIWFFVESFCLWLDESLFVDIETPVFFALVFLISPIVAGVKLSGLIVGQKNKNDAVADPISGSSPSEPKVPWHEADLKCELPLVSGLELPERTMVKINCNRARAIFSARGQEFVLPTNRLIDVSLQKTKDIEKKLVSVRWSGHAHARVHTEKTFLAFTYKSDSTWDPPQYIIFDVTGSQDVLTAKNIEKRFRRLKKSDKIRVDL